jgi:hypothetical protein
MTSMRKPEFRGTGASCELAFRGEYVMCGHDAKKEAVAASTIAKIKTPILNT